MAVQWNNNLSDGINQYSDPGLVAPSQFELLVNVSQSQLGSIAHRPGTELYNDLIAAAGLVQGLHMFMKEDGTFYFHKVSGGGLYVGNEGTDTWTSQETSLVDAASKVEFTNFIGRHYFIGEGSTEYLRYATETGNSTQVTIASGTAASSSTGSTLVATTEIFTPGVVGLTIHNTTEGTTRVITGYTASSSGTTVTVDSAINDTWDGDTIKIYGEGKFLASNGPYMMFAGASNRKAYWTNVGSDTVTTSDFYETQAPHTGLVSFGNGRPFVLFTEISYVVIDPARNYFNEVFDFGCSSHRSIKSVRGYLVWASRVAKAFLMMGPNDSIPQVISKPITNDLTLDAIVNKIAGSAWGNMAGGVIGDRYICSIGNLSSTVKGQTLDDCVVDIDLSQQAWKVHTYTTGGVGSVFAEFIDSDGNRNLYGGSKDNKAVYKMDMAGIYTDDDSEGSPQAVAMLALTPHTEFRDQSRGTVDMKEVSKIHMKYKATTAITVQAAQDGATSYSSAGLTTFPVASTLKWVWDYMDFGEPQCKSISLSFSTTGECIIFDYGLEVTSLGNEGIKGQ
jgi:hypothetical protein